MHKPAGVCIDSPNIVYNALGHVVQQNFLSEKTSQNILRNIQPIFIFTGHDHEGCDYTHPEGSREHTIRSVMGDYSGNAGLFEIERKSEGTRKVGNNGEIGKIGKNRTTEFNYSFAKCQFVRLQYLTVFAIVVIVWGVSPLGILLFQVKDQLLFRKH